MLCVQSGDSSESSESSESTESSESSKASASVGRLSSYFSQPQPAFVGNEIDNGEVKVGLVQLAEQCLVLQDHLWDGGAIDTTMMITITIDIDK